MVSKINALLLLLLVSYSTASKRKHSVLNVRKQFEYLEFMIHRNAFSLRDDLYALQEQVNATIEAQTNDVIQAHTNVCNTDYQKDELRAFNERIEVFAHGLGEEKKIADVSRKEQQNALRSTVDMFNSKFTELENRITTLENESHFPELPNRIANLEKAYSKCNELEIRLMTMVKFVSTFTKLESRITGMENAFRDKLDSYELERAKQRCHDRNGFIWNTSCYVLNTTKLTWADALKECSATGGHLAKLETEAEMQSVLPKLSFNTWIGGHDKNVEGQWQWINEDEENGENTRIQFLLWLSGQPNDSGDCLEVYSGTLNDDKCDAKNQFACENET